MVKFTQSLEHWLIKNYPKEYVLIGLGHTELLTKEMRNAYLEWCKTEDGQSYLEGGSNYKEVT